MLQKSGDHQLRLVENLPLFTSLDIQTYYKKVPPPLFVLLLSKSNKNDKFVLFFHSFLKNVHFLQIVDFLGSAWLAALVCISGVNSISYGTAQQLCICSSTFFVSACFLRTNFTNMHKNDCATRAQFCATRAQFQKVVRYHSKDAVSPYTNMKNDVLQV